MRPSAILVNPSRGPIVDEDALVDALRTGSIAGAGLDVHDIEPLPEAHPLRNTPNTVFLPHVGSVTDAAYAAMYEQAVDAIVAWRDGRSVRVLTSG